MQSTVNVSIQVVDGNKVDFITLGELDINTEMQQIEQLMREQRNINMFYGVSFHFNNRVVRNINLSQIINQANEKKEIVFRMKIQY